MCRTIVKSYTDVLQHALLAVAMNVTCTYTMTRTQPGIPKSCMHLPGKFKDPKLICLYGTEGRCVVRCQSNILVVEFVRSTLVPNACFGENCLLSALAKGRMVTLATHHTFVLRAVQTDYLLFDDKIMMNQIIAGRTRRLPRRRRRGSGTRSTSDQCRRRFPPRRTSGKRRSSRTLLEEGAEGATTRMRTTDSTPSGASEQTDMQW